MPSDKWWDEFLSWLKRIARVIGFTLARKQKKNAREKKKEEKKEERRSRPSFRRRRNRDSNDTEEY